MTKEFPKRKNLRLPEYDYSRAGYYSVTICAKEKRCIFGEVVGAGVPTRPKITQHDDYNTVGVGVPDDPQITQPDCCSTVGGDAHIAPHIELSYAGKVVDGYIRSIPGIDKYCIMPNHIHMVVRIDPAQDGPMWGSYRRRRLLRRPLQMIRAGYACRGAQCAPAKFDLTFRAHIVRPYDRRSSAFRCQQYIDENPAKWAEDEYFER